MAEVNQNKYLSQTLDIDLMQYAYFVALSQRIQHINTKK